MCLAVLRQKFNGDSVNFFVWEDEPLSDGLQAMVEWLAVETQMRYTSDSPH